ncbi:MAG: recombinase family protein [Bacillaceae bacterium]|nr:recombinase family protein [Bacillaceae bacterium]
MIDEEQAEVVRRIFREFLEGKGCPTIAKGLTRDGLKTGKGNKTWTSDAVLKILKQEKYQGALGLDTKNSHDRFFDSTKGFETTIFNHSIM